MNTKNVVVAMAIAAVFLIAAVESVAAEFACVADDGSGDAYFCDDIVTKSCTFNGTIICSRNTDGLIVGADYIAVEGNGYTIIGPGCSNTYIAGIYSMEHSNLTIENVEVTGFCEGIRVGGVYTNEEGCLYESENITIENCIVHDNGANAKKMHAIHFKPCICNSIINNCTVYNQIGKKGGSCEDGGAGIRLWGESNYNNITNNTVYNNTLAGIYSKMICQHCYVFNNTVYENGEDVSDTDSYFGGGIRLECKKTDFWTVENNTVIDNWGPGIHVRGKEAIVRYNVESSSKNATNNRGDGSDTGVGDGFFTCGADQALISNSFCDNEGEDIYVSTGGSTTGDSDENTCENCSDYHDTGAPAEKCCVNPCPKQMQEIGCVASDGTVYKCGDTVKESCTFNGNLSCEGDGIIMGRGQIRIYGDGYCIEGNGTGKGIYSTGNTFLEIHDSAIKNFEKGIWLQHASGEIFDYVIDECNINNNTIGIDVDNLDARSCTIENCEFHQNNKGTYVHGKNGTNIKITDNKIYDNAMSGIYSEDVCTGCKVDYNEVKGNGKGITVNASQWTLEHNLVTDSSGSGIYVKGTDNLIKYNTASKNGGAGIHIAEGSENVKLKVNTLCNNTGKDISTDSGCVNVSGDENACETSENYNDNGTIGCMYHSTGCVGDSGVVYRCGSIVVERCAFNDNISCPEGDGLIVWSDEIVIDGANYTIDGVDTGNCGYRAGICSEGHENITINNLEVKNFCNGIKLKDGKYGGIYNCRVHDNGNLSGITTGTAGIWLMNFKNCNIANNTIYNIAGCMEGGCEDGGIGIRLHSFSNNCSITNNTIYNTSLAGIFSKMQSMYNYVAYNNIYENGVPYWKEQGLMTAGVRLQCIKTNHWTVEDNTITNNSGSGVYIRGCHNALKYNDIGDNSGSGVMIVSNNNSMIGNTICNNEERDIHLISGTSGNTGDNNTCDTTENYNDKGTTGCTYGCFAAHVFDTGASDNPYPSIFGTHRGKIIPDRDIAVNRIYTYPCEGTGGHTEYVKIWNESEGIEGEGNWSGYHGDCHNITISPTIMLRKGYEYNYTIITGSYPQIIHAKEYKAEGGNITCTKFIDANRKAHNNWIPAVKLFQR